MKPSNLSPFRVRQLSSRMATACLILILAADCLAPAAATANRQEDAHETHGATADGRIGELPRPDRALNLSGFDGSSEPVDWQLAGQTSQISRFIPDTTPADPGDEYWTAGYYPRGVDGQVFALAVDSPNAAVYAGGDFWTAGGASVEHVAKWDALTASWSPLGTDAPGYVYALVVDGIGNLYAGGPSYVAKWDGTTWTPLGDRVNGVVQALAMDHAGHLFVGGDFDRVGGVSASSIAIWDGTTWSPLGSGVNGVVQALALDHAGSLYAGGRFTAAGGVSANNTARWDGAAWSALGDGLTCDYWSSVSALAVDGDDNLYAGGRFTTAGGVSVNYIAKWDGAAWSALGSGMNNPVDALAVDDARAEVYAGGYFGTAGGVSANYIAKWDGTVWLALGSGVGGTLYNPSVLALAIDGADSTVYAGGGFTTAGGKVASHIAKWNGAAWLPLGSGGQGIDHYVFALATDAAGAAVYAGGRFTSAGGASVNHIAKWDGAAWLPLSSGMNGGVGALAVDNTGDLYAGGGFTMAGGVSANHVAKWDARTSSWSPMGNGIDCDYCYVRALAVDRVNGPIYAGGDFYSTGLGHVAKWDGTAWSSLGSGVWGVEYPMVFALAVDRAGNLYVGGVFTYASGVRANYIAKWDGTAWSPLGSGMNDIVYALALDDAGNLYAGGHFTMAGGISANGVAKWDGTAWSPLGSGIGHPYYPEIHALAFDTTGNLYVGGVFNTAGGSSANYIAKWDGGSWSALGSGMNNQVHALAVSRGGLAVYAGGEFIRAGGKPSSYIAQWTSACCHRYLPLIMRR